MKKHRSNTEQAPDRITKMAKDIAERSRINKDLLIALAHALAANEEVQRRFRNVVLIKLARIETTVQMIHAAQIVESHGSNPGFEKKMHEHTRDAEGFITQRGHELGLKAIKYIYDEEGSARASRTARRKRPSE